MELELERTFLRPDGSIPAVRETMRTPSCPGCECPRSRSLADFAVRVRRVMTPYRLVHERVPRKKESGRVGVGAPCGYSGQPLPKLGLKFCGGKCTYGTPSRCDDQSRKRA